jgi:hypothetical protein
MHKQMPTQMQAQTQQQASAVRQSEYAQVKIG